MAVGSSNDFDLVVLGAGTGGYAAAFRASQLGLKVALVDEDKLGGTCLHRGCIPTKALLESAAFAERLRHAADFGLDLAGEAAIDYAQMAKRRDQVVTRMWKGVQSLVKKYDVTWVQGRGTLEGGTKVRVKMIGEDGRPRRRRPRPQRDRRDPRHRVAGQVAARRHARRHADRDLGRRAPDGHAARQRDRDRRRGGRGRVRVDVPRPRRDRDPARVPPGRRAPRGPRREQGARADVQPARHQGRHERPVRSRVGRRDRRRRAGSRSAPRARPRTRSRPRSCSSRRAGPPTSRTSGSSRRRPRSTAASSRSTATCGPGSRTCTRSATSSGG